MGPRPICEETVTGPGIGWRVSPEDMAILAGWIGQVLAYLNRCEVGGVRDGSSRGFPSGWLGRWRWVER